MDHLAEDLSLALEDSKGNRLRSRRHHFKRRTRFGGNSSSWKLSDHDSSSTNSIDQSWMEVDTETFRHPSVLYHSDSEENSPRGKLKRLFSISRQHIRVKRLQKSYAPSIRDSSNLSSMFQRAKRKRKSKRFAAASYSHFISATNTGHKRSRRHHFHTNFRLNKATNLRHEHDDHMNVASESSEGGGHDGDDELTDYAPTQDPPSGSETSGPKNTSVPATLDCHRVHVSNSISMTSQKEIFSEVICSFLNDDSRLVLEFCSNCCSKSKDFLRQLVSGSSCRFTIEFQMNDFNDTVKLVKQFVRNQNLLPNILSNFDFKKIRLKN